MNVFSLLTTLLASVLVVCDGFSASQSFLSNRASSLVSQSVSKTDRNNRLEHGSIVNRGQRGLRRQSIGRQSTGLSMSYISSLDGKPKTLKRFMEVECWRSPELEELYPIICR